VLVQDIEREDTLVSFISKVFSRYWEKIPENRMDLPGLVVVITVGDLPYFQGHKVVIKITHPIKYVPKKPDLATIPRKFRCGIILINVYWRTQSMDLIRRWGFKSQRKRIKKSIRMNKGNHSRPVTIYSFKVSTTQPNMKGSYQERSWHTKWR